MILWESQPVLNMFSKPVKQKINTVPEDLITTGPEWVAGWSAPGSHQVLRTEEVAPEGKGGALQCLGSPRQRQRRAIGLPL